MSGFPRAWLINRLRLICTHVLQLFLKCVSHTLAFCFRRWKRKRSTTMSAPTPTSTSTCCCTTSWAWKWAWRACSPRDWNSPDTNWWNSSSPSGSSRPESPSLAPPPLGLPCRELPPPPPHPPAPVLLVHPLQLHSLLRPPWLPLCPCLPPSPPCPARWERRWSSSSTARRPRWPSWVAGVRSSKLKPALLKTWCVSWTERWRGSPPPWRPATVSTNWTRTRSRLWVTRYHQSTSWKKKKSHMQSDISK